MTTIVNDNQLILILTEYGLGRIAEAVSNPAMNLNITKIKLGSGRNNEYYEPNPMQEELEGDLGLEFYILDKALLEDEVTVSFHAVVPESVGNFDIREVGLYETVGGVDKLFAISTQQPFVKPSSTYNYFITIDYYIFLKATNFASIYDQIVLDTEYTLVTEASLEDLLRTFVFAQGNLIDQIGQNSRIIGYDRATQLYEKINENKRTFSYVTLYKNFAAVLDEVSSIDSIFAYWAFDYSRRQNIQNSIVDLSKNRYYLTTNKYVSNYNRYYNGFMSMFDFGENDYFELSSQIPLNLSDVTAGKDLPFTMIFALEPNDAGRTRTLLAKSSYGSNRKNIFEVQVYPDNSLDLKLYSNNNNYVQFYTGANTVPQGPHSIVLTYDPENMEATAYINSTKHIMQRTVQGTYTCMDETPGTLYAFKCTPTYSVYKDTSNRLWTDSTTPYTGSEWVISNDNVMYKENIASETSITTQTVSLRAWIPSIGTSTEIIYTMDDTITPNTILYNSDYTVYTGGSFTLADGPNNTTIILYEGQSTEYDQSQDIEPVTLTLYEYRESTQEIWANSSTYPLFLYNSSGKPNTNASWTISDGKIFYKDQEATRYEEDDRDTYMPNLTSYIESSEGSRQFPINAKVGLISIIKEKLSDEAARTIALNLCASMGRNPYMTGS